MKLKTLAAIAASSMLVASFAYAAPDVDVNAQQNLAAAGTENVGAIPNASGNPQANPQGMDLSANNVDAMPSMEAGDDMSADTATGDDDY